MSPCAHIVGFACHLKNASCSTSRKRREEETASRERAPRERARAQRPTDRRDMSSPVDDQGGGVEGRCHARERREESAAERRPRRGGRGRGAERGCAARGDERGGRVGEDESMQSSRLRARVSTIGAMVTAAVGERRAVHRRCNAAETKSCDQTAAITTPPPPAPGEHTRERSGEPSLAARTTKQRARAPRAAAAAAAAAPTRAQQHRTW